MKKETKKRALSTVFAIAVIGGCGTIFTTTAPTTADQINYLGDKGYTNVEKTTRDGMQDNCRRSEGKAYYTATNKAGQREKVVVCFGAFNSMRMGS